MLMALSLIDVQDYVGVLRAIRQQQSQDIIQAQGTSSYYWEAVAKGNQALAGMTGAEKKETLILAADTITETTKDTGDAWVKADMDNFKKELENDELPGAPIVPVSTPVDPVPPTEPDTTTVPVESVPPITEENNG